jgi:hypothetical protein
MSNFTPFEKELLDLICALEACLSSIEKLLSAESKPPTSEHSCRRCNDTGEINALIPNTMADSQDIPCPDCSYSKEPEWRPMSEAIYGKEIMVKVKGKTLFTRLVHGDFQCKCHWQGSLYYVNLFDIEGWRPL